MQKKYFQIGTAALVILIVAVGIIMSLMRTSADIAMIALNDNGKLGMKLECENHKDSLVFVKENTWKQEASADKVRDALEKLFSKKEKTYDGYINALAESDVQIENVELQDNGHIIVDLKGKLVFPEACDKQRIQAQIKETIRNAVNGQRVFTVTWLGNVSQFEQAFETKEKTFEGTKVDVK